MQNITVKFRKSADLTLREFAEQIGVSFQAVSAWEHDLYPPHLERLVHVWSESGDWRRAWASECLEAYYPEAWALLCVQA